MKGWAVKPLGEVLALEYGKPLPKEDRDDNGRYPAFGANGILCRTNRFYRDKPSFIIGRKGSAGEINLAPDKFWPLDVTYFVTFDEAKYDLMFLFHALKSLDLPSLAKGVKPGINRNDIYNLTFAFPQLPEQQRIVAILGEALSRLEILRVNAEKNLRNARELFESVLQSAIEGKLAPESVDVSPAGHRSNIVEANRLSPIVESELPYEIPAAWRWCRFGSLVEFFNGDRGKSYPSRSEYVSSGIAWINTGHIRPHGRLSSETMNFISQKKFESLGGGKIQAGDLVYCLRGATIGKTAFVDPYTEGAVASSLVIIRPGSLIDRRYAYYFLTSRLGRELIKRFDNGAAQPNLAANSVAKYVTPLPPLLEQKGIVQILDTILSGCQDLQEIYRQKLAAVAELKQIVLQKAFAGELTSDAASLLGIVAKRNSEIETTSPEFSAHVLAFAYSLHALQRREKSFGHVKAQKTLHLTESIGAVELGRKPIKDAAGPNDFPHMLKAEEWAKSHRFFKFVNKDGGYDYKKLDRYDEMIAKTTAVVAPHRESLKKIVDLVLPMNTREAEVFATVHAAWNNLILDNAKITDEMIVREAREKWHPSKTTIPEGDFKKAIRSIRDKGLVPNGSAKRVGGQDMLF